MSIQNIQNLKQNQKTTDFRVKYKTQKCRIWYEKGYCPYNKLCAFAHNQQEIREKRQLNYRYKTKPCANFFSLGSCKYGDRCQYLHSIPKSYSQEQKSRSDSQETCSSKSSNQQKALQESRVIQKQFKYRLRADLIETNQLQILQILIGRASKLSNLFELTQQEEVGQNEIYQQQYCLEKGNNEQKKLRMYSM